MANTETKQRSYGGRDPLVAAYFRHIDQLPMLDKSQEGEIAKRARKGDLEAISQLFRLNPGFVLSIAQKFQRQGISLIDLVQEGNIGFMEAVTRYSAKKGAKITTYARQDVAGKMKEFLSDYKYPVRLPWRKAKVTLGIVYLDAQLEQGDGRERAMDAYEQTPSGEPTPYQIVARKDKIRAMRDMIKKSFRVLTESEKEVVVLKFGLDGREMTAREMAKKRGVSEKYVYDIVKNALKKMEGYMSVRREAI